jgi:hypothetical protein
MINEQHFTNLVTSARWAYQPYQLQLCPQTCLQAEERSAVLAQEVELLRTAAQAAASQQAAAAAQATALESENTALLGMKAAAQTERKQLAERLAEAQAAQAAASKKAAEEAKKVGGAFCGFLRSRSCCAAQIAGWLWEWCASDNALPAWG